MPKPEEHVHGRRDANKLPGINSKAKVVFLQLYA